MNFVTPLVFIRHEPKRPIGVEEYNARYDSRRTKALQTVAFITSSKNAAQWREWFLELGELIQIVAMCHDKSCMMFIQVACQSCDCVLEKGLMSVEQIQATLDEGSRRAIEWADQSMN